MLPALRAGMTIAPTLFSRGCAARRGSGLSPYGRVRPPPLALSYRGCAALKTAGLRPATRKLFVKRLLRPGGALPNSRSHLPVRVLRPGGARPGPTDAAAETRAERSPLATSAPHKRFEKSLTKNFYLISLLATSAWALAINSATVMAPRSPSFLCRGEMVPLSASLSPTTSM